MTFLPTEPVAVWVVALRSEQYKQATKALHPDDGYCCLGVMCEIAPDVAWTSDYSPERSEARFVVQDSDGTPPNAVLDKFGVDYCDDVTNLLVEMNDTGSNFETIADWIEAHTIEVNGRLVVQGEDD